MVNCLCAVTQRPQAQESKAFYLRPSQLSLGEVGECLLDGEIQAGRLQQAWQTSGI